LVKLPKGLNLTGGINSVEIQTPQIKSNTSFTVDGKTFNSKAVVSIPTNITGSVNFTTRVEVCIKTDLTSAN
jgi:hypothetical protein